MQKNKFYLILTSFLLVSHFCFGQATSLTIQRLTEKSGDFLDFWFDFFFLMAIIIGIIGVVVFCFKLIKRDRKALQSIVDWSKIVVLTLAVPFLFQLFITVALRFLRILSDILFHPEQLDNNYFQLIEEVISIYLNPGIILGIIIAIKYFLDAFSNHLQLQQKASK